MVAEKIRRGRLRMASALAGAAPVLFAAALLSAQEIIDLPAEDRWLEPHFEEIYRIGSPSGEGWEQFGNVRKVAFDGAGQLYVLDWQTLQIHVVDGSGGLRRTLGGRGEGPGEIRQASIVRGHAGRPRAVVGDTGYLAYHDLRRERGLRTPGADGFGGGGWWAYGISCPIRVQTHCSPRWGPRCCSVSVRARTPPHIRPGQSSTLTSAGDVITRDTGGRWLAAPGRGMADERQPRTDSVRSPHAARGAPGRDRGVLGFAWPTRSRSRGRAPACGGS